MNYRWERSPKEVRDDMASALYQSIEILGREKGIDPEIVVNAVEDAIALATRKYYKTVENMRGEMDRETGEIRAYVYKTVVETPELVEDPDNQLTLEQARELAPEVEVGGELRFYKDTTPLGRIAAQMAKQVIFQKVREAERDTVFNEYGNRAGEILTATVKRLEPMDVIFDLGKTEARMPKREQSRLEQFAVGERVRVVLLRVDRAAKGPQVIVSRAAPALVQSLFQSEVPEIYDGTVTIRAIAREAGERSKIAVMSRDKDVDPVGACVGMKVCACSRSSANCAGRRLTSSNTRMRSRRLRRRRCNRRRFPAFRLRIWRRSSSRSSWMTRSCRWRLARRGRMFVLPPSCCNGRSISRARRRSARRSSSRCRAMGGGPSTPIEQVTELGDSVMEKLIAAGITTVEALADMTAEELSEIPGIGEKTVEKIAVAVRHYFGHYEEGEERPVPVPSEPALVEGEEAIAAGAASDEAGDEVHSMTNTPEEILAGQAAMRAQRKKSANFQPRISLRPRTSLRTLMRMTTMMRAKRASSSITTP